MSLLELQVLENKDIGSWPYFCNRFWPLGRKCGKIFRKRRVGQCLLVRKTLAIPWNVVARNKYSRSGFWLSTRNTSKRVVRNYPKRRGMQQCGLLAWRNRWVSVTVECRIWIRLCGFKSKYQLIRESLINESFTKSGQFVWILDMILGIDTFRVSIRLVYHRSSSCRQKRNRVRNEEINTACPSPFDILSGWRQESNKIDCSLQWVDGKN